MEILGFVNLKWAGFDEEGRKESEWYDIVPVAALRGVVPVLTIDYKAGGLVNEKPDSKKVYHINRFYTDTGEIEY